MKRKIRTPYFEIGTKNYVYGDKLLELALAADKATIDRANELDMLVFACADSVAETKAIAELHPDIINPKPSELIGGSGGGVSDMGYVMEVIREIRKIDENILIEQAAGAASGIMNAEDPIAMIDEIIAATRRAADDLKK